MARVKRERRVEGREFVKKFEDEREGLVVNIMPKNDAQRLFLDILKTSKVAIASGSAGTGKTFLAATHAANEYLRRKDVKIYISRPYVPMGRTVGMLPGTVEEKMAPFLAPITNVLKKQLGKKYDADFGTNIQIQLLEAIRGLDLDNAILIVDEAQNLTKDEIKSIVTRIGNNAQVIFTGDTRQSDLKAGESGLDWLCDIIGKYDIKGADFAEFFPEDIVRSGIVKQFVMAFDSEGV